MDFVMCPHPTHSIGYGPYLVGASVFHTRTRLPLIRPNEVYKLVEVPLR